MKKIVVLFFLMLLILGHESITFASYNNDALLEEELTYQLQEVFEKRTKVWNGFLAGEYPTIAAIEKELEKFTANPLLAIDKEIFKEMMEDPTSYEIIKKVDIKHCQLIYANQQEANLIADIHWTLEGYKGIDTEKVTYHIAMKNLSNKWLLANYEVKR